MNSGLLPNLGLIALSVVMGVSGQTLIKMAVSAPGVGGLATSPVPLLLFVLRSPLVLLGLAMYGVGALAWVVVLSRLDLSFAYPFLALNFVLVALVAWLLLGESMPLMRWIGIGCICLGILFVATSARAG